ncbi:hypothetical protein B0H14DRAFT_3718702 [Mycena olivaceomarginata]|nr:hypothetical protein B0H14DRAFT_3718702 [Mycena olivaceomarginata]
MDVFTGSSSGNPWTLDDKGHLFLPKGKFGQGPSQGKVSPRKPHSPRRHIIGGPPSMIRRETRLQAVAAAAAAPPSKARMRIRYTYGKRTRREIPLMANDLYLDNERPRADAPLAGHKCIICGLVKSHPVVNKCGHSFCYVCIRLRLEHEWTCPHPNCNRTIRKAPQIDNAEAETVAADYPHRHDKSRMSYSWEGLSFPFRNKSIWLNASDRIVMRSDGLPFGVASSRSFNLSQHDDWQAEGKDEGLLWRGTSSGTNDAHTSASLGRSRFGLSKWPQYHFSSSFEDFGTNAAVEDTDFSYDLGDSALVPEIQEPASDGIILKRKVYENSDFPMLTWAEHQDEYLDEMLRLEGSAASPIRASDVLSRRASASRFYCQACVVARHAVLPTHWIQEWNGNFFERQSLKELNLVVQLGHPPGSGCQNPVKATKNFVVIDVTGIHYVDLNFCDCDSRIERRQQLMRACLWPATARDPQTCATFAVVRLFQILNCQGKVSAHDFLRSLELLTNNDGRSPVPDRRRAFRHIVRQYRITVMMKRGGWGHDSSGVNGTAQGELALRCRACPQPGRNLPKGWDRINWQEMPEDLRYKYFLSSPKIAIFAR